MERHGWPAVDSVTTLASAFETIKQNHYDLVLIDYCLPDGFGLDLIDWVRQDSAVVIMTGMGSEEIAAEAIKSGAIDYLVKNSIFPDVLPDVASRAVERFRASIKSEPVSAADKTKTSAAVRPGSKTLQIKSPSTQTRLIQTVSRIRGPLSKLLADGAAASPELQAKRLKTALANCDRILELVKQAPKDGLPG